MLAAAFRRPVAVALLAVAVACGGGGATTDPGEDVSIDAPSAPGSAEFVRLHGIERGRGTVGVVLAHMLGSSQAAWTPFADDLAGEGFHVLTFDFRGHGLSQGTRAPDLAGLDLAAAVARLRSLGATKILLVGASLGGTAAITVAAEEDTAGVVAISAPDRIDGLDAIAAVRSVREPKLFIVAEGDARRYTAAARALLAAAPDPKRLQVIEDATGHGTDLLTDAKHGDRVRKLILDFMISHRS